MSNGKPLLVRPVQWDTNLRPPIISDPFLAEAIKKFCVAEFGGPIELQWNEITWAVTEEQPDGSIEVHGLMGGGRIFDFHLMHVAHGGDTDAGRDKARRVRDLLVWRAYSYIQDRHGIGHKVLVHVSEAAFPYWRGFLRLIGAKKANRFEVIS